MGTSTVSAAHHPSRRGLRPLLGMRWVRKYQEHWMRYLPLTEADRREMLAKIGARSIDELFRDVPQQARLGGKVTGLPDHAGELEVERAFQAYAARNVSPGSAPFFIGAGAYRHHVPATVDYMIQRGEFLTSYTPYQPE